MAKKAPVKLDVLVKHLVPVEDLKPNDYNPNRQTQREFEALCQSILDHGFTVPIQARSDGTIIDGEHRWRAAQHIGMKKVPVVYMPEGVSDIQARISTLRMNRARGTDDQDLLGAMLQEMEQLGALGHMQQVLGMDDLEVQALMGGQGAADMLGGEDFSQAWEPDLLNDPQDGAYSADTPQTFGQERTYTETSHTDRVARLLNERDEAVKDVHDPLERQELKAKMLDDGTGSEPTRYTAVFRASDASVVRRVLGMRQATAFLEICKYKYLQMVEAGMKPNTAVAPLWDGPVTLFGSEYPSALDAFTEASQRSA